MRPDHHFNLSKRQTILLVRGRVLLLDGLTLYVAINAPRFALLYYFTLDSLTPDYSILQGDSAATQRVNIVMHICHGEDICKHFFI
jgi:hypothetical protein